MMNLSLSEYKKKCNNEYTQTAIAFLKYRLFAYTFATL